MRNIHYIMDAQDWGEGDLDYIMEIARKHPEAKAYADDDGRWYYIATRKPSKRDVREVMKSNGIEEE
jgi:hypothetical protein